MKGKSIGIVSDGTAVLGLEKIADEEPCLEVQTVRRAISQFAILSLAFNYMPIRWRRSDGTTCGR